MADALNKLVDRCLDNIPPTLATLVPDPVWSPSPKRPFVHPGTLMGPREARLLRARVAAGEEPWRSAAAALASEAPRDGYAPRALRRVHIDFNGVGNGHDEFVEKDGRMAYMQAVLWVATGDDAYARNAAAIVRAWACANESFTGQNAPLESAWGIAAMARAAELLKHTWADGWAKSGAEAPLFRWVDRVIMPNLRSEAMSRLPLGNWHTAVAEAKAQLAVLRDDRALFAEALRDWRRVAAAYLKPTGECAETSRDLYHSQFGLGGLVQTAEVAWQQGCGELYDFLWQRRGGGGSGGGSGSGGGGSGGDTGELPPLLRCLELHAAITNGATPKACSGYALRGIGFLPCGWEVALNHYSGRLGLPMPETEKMLERGGGRPEKCVFCWGLGTLTHFGSAVALAVEDADRQRCGEGGGAVTAAVR